MTQSTTRIAALALAAATALPLAACASVPGSGPVHVGLTDLRQSERLVQFTPAGPVTGATQEQLVRGFLSAAQSNLNDYQIARQFLAPEYAQQWDPYHGVFVSDGSKPYRTDGDAAGVLSVPLIGTADATGRLLPVLVGASTDFRFEFAKVGDEWRISSAPVGIILDRDFFVQIWSAHQLYFLGPGDRLAPETRWFLTRTALATEIVGALIAGPSERLSQSVRSAFPPGVKLTNSTVPVIDGRARVDITGDGLGSAKLQQEILLQLRASLQTVPGVNRVDLFIDGAAVRESPATPPASNAAAKAVAGVMGTEFGLISADKVEPIPGLSERVASMTPISMSLSRSATIAAVRNGDGVSIVTNGAAKLIDARTALLEPSVDDDLWTWSTSAASPGSVRVTHANGTMHELQVPWFGGQSVRSLRVSPGGSLLAALVNDGDRSFVLVGGIVRDNDGVPTSVSEEADIEAWLSGGAVDLDWVDQLRFVVLTRSGTAGKVAIGGPGLFVSDLGSLSADAQQIAGGGSRAAIRVLSSTGDLYAPQGSSGWQRVGKQILVLAKRG